MSDKTELTREEVEALLAGATPGPWGWIGTTPIALYSVPMQDVKHAILAPDDRCISRVNEQGQYVPLGSTSPDARLIAAAPTLARQLLATMDELAEARATLAAERGEAEGAPSEGWRPHHNDHGFQCWALWRVRKVIAQAHRERGLWWLTGWVPAVEALADQPFHHAREAMRAADAALATMEPPDAN